MTNLPATLSTLNQQIGALTDQLRPVPDDLIAKSIRMMLAAGMSLPATVKPENAAGVYAYALKGVATTGVETATRKIIRGEYNINHGFVPTAPEFAAMARLEARMISDDLARLREKKETIEDLATPKQVSSPEELERIRQIYANFRQAYMADKDRSRGFGATEEMTDERRERLEKILATPERSDAKPEEIAYAQRMSSQIGGAA